VATAAVESTIHIVDEQVDKLYARRHRAKPGEPVEPAETPTYPQVALVALNPHTGQVLALVGGRSYGQSQLNHAVSERPTGSIFKPFVYASAFNTAVAGTQLPGHDDLFSPITIQAMSRPPTTLATRNTHHAITRATITSRSRLAMR
jgi:penicillin-binding protein 1B